MLHIYIFIYFRADAIEIERLQKQAQQLTRRQVEVEHAEEKQAKDGRFIHHGIIIVSEVIF